MCAASNRRFACSNRSNCDLLRRCGVRAPRAKRQRHGRWTELGDRAVDDRRHVWVCAGQIEQDGPCEIEVRAVADADRQHQHHFRIAAGQIDGHLRGHETVRDDNPTIVVGAEDGISEGQAFDHACFQPGRCGDLHLVVDLEGAVENERNAGHDVAQRVLCRQAHDDRRNAHAGKQRRAHRTEFGDEVRVERDREHIDRNLRQLRQERRGRAIDRRPVRPGERFMLRRDGAPARRSRRSSAQ